MVRKTTKKKTGKKSVKRKTAKKTAKKKTARKLYKRSTGGAATKARGARRKSARKSVMSIFPGDILQCAVCMVQYFAGDKHEC